MYKNTHHQDEEEEKKLIKVSIKMWIHFNEHYKTIGTPLVRRLNKCSMTPSLFFIISFFMIFLFSLSIPFEHLFQSYLPSLFMKIYLYWIKIRRSKRVEKWISMKYDFKLNKPSDQNKSSMKRFTQEGKIKWNGEREREKNNN